MSGLYLHFYWSGAATKEEVTIKEEDAPCKGGIYIIRVRTNYYIIAHYCSRISALGTVKIIAFVFVYRVKYTTNIAKRR